MPAWFSNAYNEMLPFDGHDPINKTINGESYANNPELETKVKKHQASLFTKFAVYFNLPSRMRGISAVSYNFEEPGFLSLLKELFYQPNRPNVSTARKVAGAIAGVLMLPFRLFSVACSTLAHTVMLLTELLPLSLYNLCIEKLGADSKVASFFKGMLLVLRAITSPITNWKVQGTEGHAHSFGTRGKVISGIITALVLGVGVIASFLTTIGTMFIAPTIVTSLTYADVGCRAGLSLYSVGTFLDIGSILINVGKILLTNFFDRFRNTSPEPTPAADAGYKVNRENSELRRHIIGTLTNMPTSPEPIELPNVVSGEGFSAKNKSKLPHYHDGLEGKQLLSERRNAIRNLTTSAPDATSKVDVVATANDDKKEFKLT